MREVVHARSIKFLRVQNDRLPSGRILCDKGIFFPYDRFTGYKKSNQNQFGRALQLALICIMDSKETGLETSSRHRFQHDGNSWRHKNVIREVKFDVYDKRQTFTVCLQLSVQQNQNICICSE